MRKIKGDFWALKYEWKVIPINCILEKDGGLVMGGGLAKAAKEKYPDLPYEVSAMMWNSGINVFIIREYNLILFPTKIDWRNDSSLELIEFSAKKLAKLLENKTIYFRGKDSEGNKVERKILLPRLGCGLGNLDWQDVRKVLLPIFQSNKFVVCYKEEK